MEPKKLYTVVTTERYVRNSTAVEAVFSTRNKAERYLNHFFKNAKNTERYIVETLLDPLEEEINNENHYYFAAAYVEDDEDFYRVQVDRTSDNIYENETNQLRFDGDELPDIDFYCFASSPEEAYQKFRSHLLPYFEEHNITLPLTEPKYNQHPSFY